MYFFCCDIPERQTPATAHIAAIAAIAAIALTMIQNIKVAAIAAIALTMIQNIKVTVRFSHLFATPSMCLAVGRV